MKKLLSLLSVLTISGSAVPTTIAASPYKNEEKLNKIKREIKTDIEFNCSGDNFFTKRRITGTFNPNTWEKINSAYGTINKVTALSSPSNSSQPLKNVIFNSSVDNKCGSEFYPQLSMSEFILINWDKIDAVWKESNRQRKIKISIAGNVFGHDYYLESIDIINDGAIYENDYLNNFNNDFSNTNRDVISKQKRSINNSDNILNLGIIENDSDSNILNKIKSLYPKIDISHFEIIEKSDYSYINQNFSAKLVVKNNSNRYPVGMQKNLIFNTNIKINDLSKKIQNDDLVIKWLQDINDYNKNLPTKIENLKTYINQQKWSQKNIEKEIIKGYIRDFGHIIRLIENEWKINELNNTVKGIKNEINNLKNEINNLNSKIINLETSSLSFNCANISTIGAGVSAPMSVIGTITSAFFTLVAGACAIFNS